MKTHRIKTGYTIPIKGDAGETVVDPFAPSSYGMYPVEFKGILPRLNVKLNDTVKVGTPLFHDKKRPEIKFGSPAAGKVSDIQYGPRRVIEKITITPSGSDCEQFQNFRLHEIASIQRETLIDLLLGGCVWPSIRQRPFDTIPDPHTIPSSIFVNCMDTAPLANRCEFSLKDKVPEFQAGIAALRVLCNTVHVVVNGKDASSIFLNVDGVEKHSFIGKHPAGLVGTHISRIDPISHGKTIWYLNARDVVTIGSFLLVGQYPTERIVAVAGLGASERRYCRTTIGANLSSFATAVAGKEIRWISGNVLTGRSSSQDDHLGFYDDLVTMIPEGRERHFLGWMMPGFFRPSYSRTFASQIFFGKEYGFDTNLNGGPRAFVKTGDYEKVMGLDVYPAFLAKAILSEDIDTMEQLGILECSPEDFALCSYICPSKIEFTEIIEKGLKIIEKEIS